MFSFYCNTLTFFSKCRELLYSCAIVEGQHCGDSFTSGHPPFLAENYEDLKEKITKKDMPPPKVRGLCSSCISLHYFSCLNFCATL